MTGDASSETANPQTKKTERSCPHCREYHEVSVVVEPGWERIVYCPRTGCMG